MSPRPRLPITLTRDFARMPEVARAEVLFVSATQLTWRGFLTGGPLVFRMMRRLKRTPGFVCHRGTYRFPLTTGALAFFDSYEALEEFARSPEHRALVTWGQVPGRIRSGFIRIMSTAPTGSAFGEWVPEDVEKLDRRRLMPVVRRETTRAVPAGQADRPAVPAAEAGGSPAPGVAVPVMRCPVLGTGAAAESRPAS